MTENQVDLIVTDIQMKPMDGITFTDRVKHNLPDQKILDGGLELAPSQVTGTSVNLRFGRDT